MWFFDFLWKKRPTKVPVVQVLPEPAYRISSKDIKAIAGDDVLATQLDLARAYIEMGKKTLAKKILLHVIEHGTPLQQTSAHQLMNYI